MSIAVAMPTTRRTGKSRSTTFRGVRKRFLDETRKMTVEGMNKDDGFATKEAISSLTGDDREEEIRQIDRHNYLKGQGHIMGQKVLFDLQEWADKQKDDFNEKVVALNAIVVVKNENKTFEGYWIASSTVPIEIELLWKGQWITVIGISHGSVLGECLIGKREGETVVCSKICPPRTVTIEAIG